MPSIIDISFILTSLFLLSHFRIYKIDRVNTVKVGEWKNGKKASSIVIDAHKRWQGRQNNGNV